MHKFLCNENYDISSYVYDYFLMIISFGSWGFLLN